MVHTLIKDGKYSYLEVGDGKPIIILHGLMGGLSNFDGVTDYFSKNGYKVVIPELPVYTMSLVKTNVKSFANYLALLLRVRNSSQLRQKFLLGIYLSYIQTRVLKTGHHLGRFILAL